MGNPDLEVELDSLGLFFTRLIDDDACQDDAEASNAEFVEVTILSSDSEILPLPKFRQANRKVKFSHPLAYLDPKFHMKTQQHEARRTTRHSGQVVTSTGYQTVRFENAAPRSLTFLLIYILKRVSSVNLLTHPTPIIRLLLIHLLVNRRPLSCHR